MDPSTLAGQPKPSDVERENGQAPNGSVSSEASSASKTAAPPTADKPSRLKKMLADARTEQPALFEPSPVPALPLKYGLVELPPAPRAPARPTIAYFCYEDPSTPIGQHVASLVKALARRNNPVHLFSRAPFDLDMPGLTVTAVGAGPEDNLLSSVEEYTRRVCAAFGHQYPAGSAPTVLFGQEWSSFPALTLLREHTRQDIHAALHSLERQRGNMSTDLNRRIDEIETAMLREARTVLIHDQAAGEVASYWVPECKSRLQMVRQPFPLHKFNSGLDAGNIKARYQIGPIDPTVLFVGNLDERHGPDILMKSVPAILKNHPQTRFAFVGEGTLLWPLRVYARYLNLEGVVRLLGHREGQELYELIQACDVMAVPSRDQTEWWPLQAAWAAGKPVVATHSLGGNLLEHEKDCVLVYPHESSFVWGVERVLYDDKLRTRLAENGAQKLEQRFGFNCVAEQLEALLGIKRSV